MSLHTNQTLLWNCATKRERRLLSSGCAWVVAGLSKVWSGYTTLINNPLLSNPFWWVLDHSETTYESMRGSRPKVFRKEKWYQRVCACVFVTLALEQSVWSAIISVCIPLSSCTAAGTCSGQVKRSEAEWKEKQIVVAWRFSIEIHQKQQLCRLHLHLHHESLRAISTCFFFAIWKPTVNKINDLLVMRWWQHSSSAQRPFNCS